MARRSLAILGIVSLTGAALLSGCCFTDNERLNEVRCDPSPNIDTMSQRSEDVDNAMTVTLDENGRKPAPSMAPNPRADHGDRSGVDGERAEQREVDPVAAVVQIAQQDDRAAEQRDVRDTRKRSNGLEPHPRELRRSHRQRNRRNDRVRPAADPDQRDDSGDADGGGRDALP